MPVHPSPFTPIEDAAIVNMHREGLSQAKIARLVHKSDKRLRLRLEALAADGLIEIRSRQARTDEAGARSWRAATNVPKKPPANADDNRPLVLGVKTDPTWSFSCRVAREMNR